MTAADTGTLICLTTVGSSEAGEEIAEILVRERLAACVQVVPGVRSVYLWQDEIHHDDEHILLLKTTAHRWKDLEARLTELHPYELPEIVALPVERGLPAYLDWVGEAVEPNP